MKPFFFPFILMLVLCSCSHRIQRIGYSVKKSEYWDCDLPVKKAAKIDCVYKKIAEIHFGDCKNSKIRSEEDVLNILKKEGCAIDAEFALIKEESVSTTEKVCYQCKADYYVKKTASVSNTDYGMSTAKKSLTPTEYALYSVGLGVIITLLVFYTTFF